MPRVSKSIQQTAEAERIAEIFHRLCAAQPDPRTELAYASPYELLVAVVLSAQATDVSVNKATTALYQVAATPEAMVVLGVEGLTPFIASIGLFRNKAKNVIALSKILLEDYGGQVPITRAALEALPGVGRKTAIVVLNELNIEPAIAVDTHVFRVAHRLNLADASTPDKVEAQLMAKVAEPYLTRAHHWMILLGRYVCVARKPKCETCPISDLCPSRELFLGT